MASSSHGQAASRKRSLDSVEGSPLASRKRSQDSVEGSPLASRKHSLDSGQAPLALVAEERLALPAPKRSAAIRRGYDYVDAAEYVELKILLPDGGHVILHEESDDELPVVDLLRRIKRKVSKDVVPCSVQWGPHVYLEDAAGNRIQDGQIFNSDERDRTLILQDGQPHGTHSLQDMWNVTPDPELLNTLPQEYTLETALADLLDNSLQAVWANAPGEKRLISVTLSKDKITIFDSGQGMDSTTENSIAKWGTMGSSKHRAVRFSAVGGKPPFLRPFFGMYGFGGLIAAMHLGGVAVVSSKTKSSNKVVTLTLEKDNLMETSRVERTWKTPGEYREPTKEELRIAPHGSFTKVELSKLKEKLWTESHVKCMLKDIYFPYIQCDEADSSQRTTTPVEFQVNDTNLAEVYGGEVAITNMYSSNGSPFVIDIHVKKNGHNIDPDLVNEFDRANARIKCLYFPIQQGKESIDTILEELSKEEVGIHETFDNFCRVAIRRLGRLLPDARWGRLPFMEPKRKRADKASVPKICFERVKALVDTDAGFVPTTSKMDLLTGHAFTSLLKNLGTRGNMPEDVTLEIFRETRKLKLQDVEKEYQEWIREMHELFDEEVECEDQPHLIVTEHLKELGFSQDVYRVYLRMNRKGSLWKHGMKLKFKGLPGHKKDFYATLECFLADGLSEDKGNTKVICRPMEIAKEEGSILICEEETTRFEMRKSVAIPIEFLTPDKCETLHDSEWKRTCDNKRLHGPGEIEILDRKILQRLGLEGGITPVVKAGVKPFNYIYAVVRPNIYMKSIQEGKEVNPVDQRNIVKKSMQMKLQLRHMNSSENRDEENSETDISMLVNEKSVNNIQGFYCFGIENGDFRRFYTKAGKYVLTLSVMDEGNSEVMLEKTLVVRVLPSDKVGKWILQNVDGSGIPVCRLGSEIGPLLLQCLDEYGNVKNVDVTEDLRFEVWSGERKLQIDLSVKNISQQENSRTSLLIEAIKLTGGLLRGIAMDYAALLKLVVSNRPVASMELNVLPGEMASIRVVSIDDIDNCLRTGDVIHLLTLQVMDGYGNPVEKGRKVVLQLDNVELQDSQGLYRMVDDRGCICLGGLLKVTGPFNSRAAICVYSENQKLLYKKEFSLLKRTLQIVSTIPKNCAAGGILCDITVQIVDENGNIDKTMTGGQHFIALTHVEQRLYPMKEGTCHIKEIQLPDEPGPWCCHINHMMSQELQAQIEMDLVPGCDRSFDAPDTPSDSDKSPKLMLHDKTGVRKDLKRLNQSLIAHLEELKKKMVGCVNKLRKAEDELDKLDATKKAKVDKISLIEGEIESLQKQAQNIQHGSAIDGQDKNVLSPERIAQAISKTSFPAKFFLEAFCSGSFLAAEAGNPYIADILGVVCLLASMKDAAISQAVAEFIGQDSMIAVVCKTKEAARLLVRLNSSDGTIDETWGLYKFIRNQNKNAHGKLRMFILQDMRCNCKVRDESDPQKLLNMEVPKLNGAVPKGFKGYAVNLLHLNKEHLNFRVTDEDHGGLRGSLFYCLLKELQVYDTHKNLFDARDVLTTGGISLDGGLIRERGCEDFGTRGREEAKITFPLYSKSREEIPKMRSMINITQSVQIKDNLKAKRQELQECKAQLGEVDERMKFVKKQIKAREEKCTRVSQEMASQKKEVAQLEENLRGL